MLRLPVFAISLSHVAMGKNYGKAAHVPGRTNSVLPHVPTRARRDGRENLLEQAPPLATHIVRSHRDLAKPYLQVVHSSVLASSDPPISPCPDECHTCASGLGPSRLQRCFAHLARLCTVVFWHPPTLATFSLLDAVCIHFWMYTRIRRTR